MTPSADSAQGRRAILALLKRHRVMLESARGSVPSFAAEVAGDDVSGSWWGHPKAREIYAATQIARDSDDVLVCRLVAGKVTYVHRDIWPALVRLAKEFNKRDLAWIEEVHTDSGRHEVVTTLFPEWVPEDVMAAAQRMTEEQARRQLDWLSVGGRGRHR